MRGLPAALMGQQQAQLSLGVAGAAASPTAPGGGVYHFELVSGVGRGADRKVDQALELFCKLPVVASCPWSTITTTKPSTTTQRTINPTPRASRFLTRWQGASTAQPTSARPSPRTILNPQPQQAAHWGLDHWKPTRQLVDKTCQGPRISSTVYQHNHNQDYGEQHTHQQQQPQQKQQQKLLYQWTST